MTKKDNLIARIQLFLVCIFFGSLNFEMFSPFVEDMSVSKIAMFLYILGTLLTPLGEVFNTSRIRGVLASIFIMGAFMVLSSMLNGCHRVFDMTLFLNMMMFWLLLNHYRRDPRIFEQGLLWFALSAALVGILFMFGIGVSVGEVNERFTIFNDNQNTIGIKMAISILFLMNYTLHHSVDQPIYKPWLLALTIPMLMLLFGTASRTATLIVAVGVVLFFLLRPSLSHWIRVLWLLVGAVVIYFGIRLIGEQELLMSRILQTMEEGSIAQRDVIWAMYWERIKANPIFGVGFTGGEQVALKVFGMLRSPHNVFVEVALYSGILGFIPFLYFIYTLYRDAIKYARVEKNLAPILMSVGLTAMLLAGQALNVKLFWTMAAFAISFHISHHRQPRR